MVNFNNDATVGIPATDIEKISILQRRYDLIEAIEAYYKNKFKGIAGETSIISARLMSLFYEIQAMLKRRHTPKAKKKGAATKADDTFEKIKKVCTSTTTIKIEDVVNVLELINDELDVVRLTRIDTQKVYDETDIEEELKEQGY